MCIAPEHNDSDKLRFMRTTLIVCLCCVSLAAVALDLLVFRPVTARAQGAIIHVAEMRVTTISGQSKLSVDNDVVGFSCVADRTGEPKCYLATK